MQVIPGALSNCALLVKFKSPVDVGTVLEKKFNVYVCVEKRMIATASIFSIAGMLLILIQCTYRFSLLMLKGQSLAHSAVLHKVEHLNNQKSTCMMSGQVNANKIIVM